MLAEWETFFLKEKKKIVKPIFISGLPRSGTTLVTSLINQHTETGSYNYKDLPFHRIPLIWNKLRDARDNGLGVLLISAHLDELIGLSDRNFVIYEGSFVKELDPEEASPELLGSYMTGLKT